MTDCTEPSETDKVAEAMNRDRQAIGEAEAPSRKSKRVYQYTLKGWQTMAIQIQYVGDKAS